MNISGSPEPWMSRQDLLEIGRRGLCGDYGKQGEVLNHTYAATVGNI